MKHIATKSVLKPHKLKIFRLVHIRVPSLFYIKFAFFRLSLLLVDFSHIPPFFLH